MGVEGRDFVDLGLRHFHLEGERGQMWRGDVAVMILDQMQMFDQQIAAARSVDQQRLDISERGRIDLAALRRARRFAAAGAVSLAVTFAIAAGGRRIVHIH
jgi:hypothetical protein